MDKKVVAGLILFIILFAVLPFSAGAEDEENYIKNTSSGNAFGAGENIQINQDIQGDLVLAGSLLEINGKTGDDFIGAGGEVIVNGDVSGNIIAAGGSIKVNGDVGGDVAAFGGQIFLSQDSVVEGDILLGGGEVTLNGMVNGDGEVSTGTLRTGNDFKINGDFDLEAENYPSNLKDNVEGNLSIIKTAEQEDQYGDSIIFSILSFILELISALALGFILLYIFPASISEIAKIVKVSTFKSLLIGFLTLVFIPILSIILLLTLFGWSLSVFLILFLTLTILIATVPVKLFAGKIIYSRIFKKEAGKIGYYALGAIIFTLAYEIPLLGGLIRFIALIIGLGGIIIWLGEHVKQPG